MKIIRKYFQTKIKSFDKAAFSKYFQNTSWMIFEKVFRLGITMLVGIYVARYLGPERYGVLGYVVSLIGLFQSIPSLGTRSILLKELATAERTIGSYLGSAFVIHITGGLIAISLTLVYILFANSQAEFLLILILSITYFTQAPLILELYFQAKVKAKYSAITQLVSTTLINIIRISFVYWEQPLLYFVTLLAAEQILISIGLMVSYIIKGGNIKSWHFDYALTSRLLKNSFPFILSGVFVSVYMKIDQVMITEMLNERENGIYSAAVKISESWYFIPVTIANSLVPAIAFAKQKSESFYYNRIQKLYNLLAWIAIPVAFLISLLSPVIINLLYGKAFIEAAQILSLHIWAAVFIFVGVGSDKWLIQEGRYKLSFYRTVIGAVVNIILNLILIPKVGIIGAAWSTLIAYSTSGYFAYLFMKNTFQTFRMQSIAIFFPLVLVYRYLKHLNDGKTS